MAAALIDRVQHHCHLVNIRGNSYRMREHTELHRALLQSDVEDPAEAVRRPRKSKASAGH
jgi:IstB-like ATP binding protein